jgi:hypothetical protein
MSSLINIIYKNLAFLLLLYLFLENMGVLRLFLIILDYGLAFHSRCGIL